MAERVDAIGKLTISSSIVGPGLLNRVQDVFPVQ
jgi:hypothetical protein